MTTDREAQDMTEQPEPRIEHMVAIALPQTLEQKIAWLERVANHNLARLNRVVSELNLPGAAGRDTLTVAAELIEHRVDEAAVEARVRAQIAAELLAVDPVEWALAGMRAGEDAARIARGETRPR